MAPLTSADAAAEQLSLVKRFWGGYGVFIIFPWIKADAHITITVLAGTIGVILVVALLCCWLWVCTRNRKRAKTGQPPAYATTWMGPAGGYYHTQQPVQTQPTGPGPYYAGAQQQNQYQPPPPAYGTHPPANDPYPQQTGVGSGAADTYYYGQDGSNSNSNGNYNNATAREEYEMRDYPPPNSPPPSHAKYNS
ncbi:hypothetical protein BZA70DRAFT_268997 [Myxozyma melibiosi]|uniref:Uncharacterized protein n=1 Tax=Myxozyma melibiosi TaxID=54550 RepID=A0ABR1F157_9ASCO